MRSLALGLSQTRYRSAVALTDRNTLRSITRAFLPILALATAPARADEASFAKDVLPILERNCVVCHQGAEAQKGLRLGSAAGLIAGGESGPAVIPGDPEGSLLLAKVVGDKPEMPLAGEPLASAEIELIRDWISAGAIDDAGGPPEVSERTWWSFRPFRIEDEPAPVSLWERNVIDGFLLRAMQSRGLEPSAPSDRKTLIRRLSFDLTGLPPEPAEVESFAGDRDPGAYARLVDRLLASPAYGERWGRHWLDVARFGESNGYEQNHLRDNAWPYRDWVIRSFNEDKPYNRMILEQLAGDQLAPDDLNAQAATGFLVAGPHDTVGIKNAAGEAQKRANHLDDMIMGTASAFLGLTVHCARCHDHKFDPISNEDYYRMQAVLAGVSHGDRTWDDPARVAEFAAASERLNDQINDAKAGLDALREAVAERVDANREAILRQYRPRVDQSGTEETFDPILARFVRMRVDQATGNRNRVDLDELAIFAANDFGRNVALGGRATVSGTRVDSASPDTYAPANLIDGKHDRRWISTNAMPAWIQIELAKPERIDRIDWSSDRLGGFGGRFGPPQPEEYEISVSLDGDSWNTVASSEGRLPYAEADQERLLLRAVFSSDERLRWDRLEEVQRESERALARLPKPQQAFLGRFQQPDKPSFVMVRGDPMNEGPEVAPGSLSTLSGLLAGFELAVDAPEAERRLALAKWIASDDNVLAARVIVNRVWMHHFGQPFLRNPSDFGVNGGVPSHPELLDWLAHRLIHTHNWRLKPLHREIVLSAAYRQSSTFRKNAARVDSDGAFLWRYPPRRLGAEELRDAILRTSGNLDRHMGGPGFRLYRYTVDNVATYYPLGEFSPDTYRRGIYHQHARSVKPELLGEFDCPETSLPAPKRITTTSPLQALTLLNSTFVVDQASSFAALVETESDEAEAGFVEAAWRRAYLREPSAVERQSATEFVAQHGLEALSRAILNSNEFLYVF
ncbi:MAG: DUF1553 domain-containing protein [Acidobacteriia bacterium]|nr:DUF1553 domain-containing protein [Terriglobia bacterium]MYG02060.1 DUF1553 domain-containing protein [Terriglobia bacterium]MYK09979.1 DUF1553 domain-containing protein [Terriglobia bacterium]